MKKGAIVTFLFFVIACLAILTTLNNLGYCYDKDLFFEENAILNITIGYEIHDRSFDNSSITIVEEFLDEFPNCCSVSDFRKEGPFFYIFFPKIYKTLVAYDDKLSVIFLDSCGKKIERNFFPSRR